LSLSKKAKSDLPKFEKIWDTIQSVIEELIGDENVLFQDLQLLEKNIKADVRASVFLIMRSRRAPGKR